MMHLNPKIPIEVIHLFPKIDVLLLELLKSLTIDEWNAPTICKLWTVKDIVSHLLDGNLRGLSTSRDNFYGEIPQNINSYSDLVGYLNELNADCVKAAKRLSNNLLISLLENTGKQYYAHLQTLHPFEKAIFSVSWAGQDTSENWFHIAREYTEKFIHQQQIREAVSNQALFTKELFYPFIHTFMYTLPHTFRYTNADLGTVVSVKIKTDIGGEWRISKTENTWQFTDNQFVEPSSFVIISPEMAWKLFSKGISPDQALPNIEIIGDQNLGKIALEMVSVMA